jgi:DNA topoisomerase IA
MRTDSTQMAKVAMDEARKVIGSRFGVPYVVAGGRVYKSKARARRRRTRRSGRHRSRAIPIHWPASWRPTS